MTPIPRAAALIHKERKVFNTLIKVAFGDITSEHVDAVISITDEKLKNRAGVAGAVQRNGGIEVVKECGNALAKLGTLELGQTLVTNSGHMPCRKIIHTVGPVTGSLEGDTIKGVILAVKNALTRADELHFLSVSLPGSFLDIDCYSCACAVATAVLQWLDPETSLREIRLISWDSESVRGFEQILNTSEEFPSLCPSLRLLLNQ